jgi:hypothetical protein
MRVHQGGRGSLTAVPLRIRITNADDVVVFERIEEAGAERFGGDRAADVRVELPVRDLEPGEYLLTIEVPDHPVRRFSRFRVTVGSR